MIAPPDGKTRLMKANGVNSDIIRTIHLYFPKAVEQTREYSQQFKRCNVVDSGRAVWDYLRDEIKYKRDPESSQMIRLPSRFVHDRTGDCKSFSLFAASVLHNLGYRVAFRYASYNLLNSTPSHVYVVAKDKQGRQVIVDGVYNEFNDQKKPAHYFDRWMDVYALSGIGRRKKKKKRILKKVGLAPARRAFRTLVALNVKGLANKLLRAYRADQKALASKWEALGGSWAKLQDSINKGTKRKALGGIGVLPIADPVAGGFAATLAIAAPIIIALIPLLKKLGADKEGEGESYLDKIEAGAEQAVKAAGVDPSSYAVDPETSSTEFDTEPGKDDTPGFRISPVLLIGGLAAVVLLSRK